MLHVNNAGFCRSSSFASSLLLMPPSCSFCLLFFFHKHVHFHRRQSRELLSWWIGGKIRHHITCANRTEPIDPQTTMFQSTIYARHERRRLDREAAQRQGGASSSHDAHDGKIVSSTALGEVSPPAMASASASAATFAATTSSMDVPSSSSVSSTAHLPLSGYMDSSSATSISFSDDEPLASANPSYEHHRHHQPQSYTKGSTLLLAASAAATSAWTFSRTAQGARPLHAPFLSASGTTTAGATAGTRQVVLLAGACVAAGGHCCPISSPFRAGAGLPVAAKMSVLGVMSFYVGGRYASRVHRHQHH